MASGLGVLKVEGASLVKWGLCGYTEEGNGLVMRVGVYMKNGSNGMGREKGGL